MFDIIVQALLGFRDFLFSLREMLWQSLMPNLSKGYEQFSNYGLNEKLNIVWGGVGIFIAITCFLLALSILPYVLHRPR